MGRGLGRGLGFQTGSGFGFHLHLGVVGVVAAAVFVFAFGGGPAPQFFHRRGLVKNGRLRARPFHGAVFQNLHFQVAHNVDVLARLLFERLGVGAAPFHRDFVEARFQVLGGDFHILPPAPGVHGESEADALGGGEQFVRARGSRRQPPALGVFQGGLADDGDFVSHQQSRQRKLRGGHGQREESPLAQHFVASPFGFAGGHFADFFAEGVQSALVDSEEGEEGVVENGDAEFGDGLDGDADADFSPAPFGVGMVGGVGEFGDADVSGGGADEGFGDIGQGSAAVEGPSAVFGAVHADAVFGGLVVHGGEVAHLGGAVDFVPSAAFNADALNHEVGVGGGDVCDRSPDADAGEVGRGDVGVNFVSAADGVVAVFGGLDGDLEGGGADDDAFAVGDEVAVSAFFLVEAGFGAAGEFFGEVLLSEAAAHHFQGDAAFSESGDLGGGSEFFQPGVDGGVDFVAVEGHGFLPRERVPPGVVGGGAGGVQRLGRGDGVGGSGVGGSGGCGDDQRAVGRGLVARLSHNGDIGGEVARDDSGGRVAHCWFVFFGRREGWGFFRRRSL